MCSYSVAILFFKGFRVYNDYTEDVQIDLSDLTDFPSNLTPEEPNGGAVSSNNNYIEPVDSMEGTDGSNGGPSFAQKLRAANTSPLGVSKTCWGTASPSRGQNLSF